MDRVLARLLVLALVGILAFPALSAAQMTRGSLGGTVRDDTGGVLPGVSVTITNEDTGIVRTVVTNAEGFYRLPALEPGGYTVTAELTGFRRLECKHVGQVTTSEETINPELKVGGMTDTIVVEGREANRAQQDEPQPRHDRPRARSSSCRFRDRNINNLTPRAEHHRVTGHGSLRQRQARAQQQLHDRRHRQQRPLGHHPDHSGPSRGSGRVPECRPTSPRRVRPQHRRPDQRHHPVGHEHVPRRGVGLLPLRNGLNSLDNIEKANGLERAPRVRASPGRRSVGGPIIKNKTFFFALFQYDGDNPAGETLGGTVRIPTPPATPPSRTSPCAPARPAEPPGRAAAPLLPERPLLEEPGLPQRVEHPT